MHVKKVNPDRLREYFDRIAPMIPELFHIAYAICGTVESAEYALVYALMDVWLSESRGSIAMRDSLRNTVREVALEERNENEEDCTWDGRDFSENPLLEPLGREKVLTRRIVVLRCGCNFSFSAIAELLEISNAEVKREYARFKGEWAQISGVSQRNAELLNKKIRRQMLIPSHEQPDAERIFKGFAEDALQTARPKHIVSRILRGLLGAAAIAACAVLFWLICILI